jgi:hypothetical protein
VASAPVSAASSAPVPRAVPTGFKKVPAGDDGLSSNPYRR